MYKLSVLKKLWCVFLVVVILCSLNTNVLAEIRTSDSTNSKIISALNATEYIKNEIGLSDVNFEEIYIATPIMAYDYTTNGFEVNRIFYPLLFNNELVAFAVSIDEGGSAYQITTLLVSEINAVINENTEFAIVYDANGCSIYDGTAFTRLVSSSESDNMRISLDETSIQIECVGILLTNISQSSLLGYTSNTGHQTFSTTAIYYSCDVDYVTQLPSKTNCWAAAVACIVNYRKGQDYTATDVADNHLEYYGNSIYNMPGILKNGYNVSSYEVYNDVPSDGLILNNIKNDYPLYASFTSSNGGSHAVVIHAINVIAGYIYIMDPEFGFTSYTYVSSTGKYQYVSTYSGATMTLYRACCRYSYA